MVKYIKRKSDNKFLQVLETDSWVDSQKDSLKMTYKECEDVKETLFLTYGINDFIEVVNMVEWKDISNEEKKELRNLLKKS